MSIENINQNNQLPQVIDIDLAYSGDHTEVVRRFVSDDEDDDGGDTGGNGRLDPFGRKRGGLLVTETINMEDARRMQEQRGHRRFAKVNGRDRQPAAAGDTLGEEAEKAESPLAHPFLDSQRFDGIDPDLNPEPAINTAARTEYDNAKREQQLQKQMRLGNAPTHSRTFNPTPGF